MKEIQEVLTAEQKNELAAEEIRGRLGFLFASLLKTAVSQLNAAEDGSDQNLVLEKRRKGRIFKSPLTILRWREGKEGEDSFTVCFTEAGGELLCSSFGVEFGKKGENGSVAVVFDSQAGKINEITASGPFLRKFWLPPNLGDTKSAVVKFNSLDKGKIIFEGSKGQSEQPSTVKEELGVHQAYLRVSVMLHAVGEKLLSSPN